MNLVEDDGTNKSQVMKNSNIQTEFDETDVENRCSASRIKL